MNFHEILYSQIYPNEMPNAGQKGYSLIQFSCCFRRSCLSIFYLVEHQFRIWKFLAWTPETDCHV
jgi:hypothetical protein